MRLPVRSTLSEAEPQSSGTAMPGSANCTMDLEGAITESPDRTPWAIEAPASAIFSLVFFEASATAAASALIAAESLVCAGGLPVRACVAWTR